MPIHFLLGPAGSGKTHRCLAGVRQELLRAPVGPNLVFLAPKQATYQLERQLLEDPRLSGWSRLQILSFDRLSRQILESTRPVELLAEEGRLMVLRALLRRLAPQLRVFHAAARLAGFAQELSAVLRELRNHHLGSRRLLELASHLEVSGPLSHKLHDLSLLLHAYQSWLADHGVEDADSLPDLATRALLDRSAPFQIGGLWLDGFAEMTPQELDLLAAVVQRSDHATLAFCLDHLPSTDAPWLSTWSVVSQTFRRCHTRLAALPGPDHRPTPPRIRSAHPVLRRFRHRHRHRHRLRHGHRLRAVRHPGPPRHALDPTAARRRFHSRGHPGSRASTRSLPQSGGRSGAGRPRDPVARPRRRPVP